MVTRTRPSSSETPTLNEDRPPNPVSHTIIVDWDGPDDPENPKNWSYNKRWSATLIVSAFTFISPVSSSMVAPAAAQVARDLNISSSVETALVVSVFVLAYAIGPLFLGPLSEMYGRSLIIQWSNLFFLIWNLACGFAQTKGQLIAFRFLSGLGGSAPLAIGGGVIADCWGPHERGQAIAIYSLAPLLGPVIGPVAGAWISERTTWRWVFRSTSIVDAMIQISGFVFLRETYAPLLLERKAKKILANMDSEKRARTTVRTVHQSDDRHWKRLFAKSLFRPFIIFTQEPIIQVLGVYLAFIYGTIYLTLTTIPAIFEGIYHHTVGIAGLHYIALGVGLSFTSQLNARLLDRSYVYWTKRNGGVGRPEYRLPTMVPGTIMLPVGLLMSGWAAQQRVHWIVVDIGLALIGGGMILTFQGCQTYTIDAFAPVAASALAAVSCFRSLAGFGFPLFAPVMYDSLGYGLGNTVLAAFAVVVGCPAPWILWRYGERIRGMSRNATPKALDSEKAQG